MPTKSNRPLRLRPIPEGGHVVIVRGEEGSDDARRRSAERFRRRWPELGFYGLSGYFAEDEVTISDIVVSYLYSFLPTILVYEADALREAAFEVLPTFKAPHVTIAFEGLEEGLAVLAATPKQTREYDIRGRRIGNGR